MLGEKTCTVAEAAKVLGLTEYTVRKKIRDGDIKAIKGSSDREGYKIPLDELMRYDALCRKSRTLRNFYRFRAYR